jgi:hypothetical protein
MNKVIDDELNRFTMIKSLDEDNLNIIVKEYKNLNNDEQSILSFLWTIEEIIIKNQLRNKGKSTKDIKREDTCLYKLMKVENI